MAIPRIGGGGIPFNLTGALGGPLPNESVVPWQQFNPSRGSNAVTLQAGEFWQLPANTWLITPGPYTSIQWYDPVTGIYRTIGADTALLPVPINSDGGNYRLANLTGCAIGALITNAGSLYTNGIGAAANGITVAASAGASTWQAVTGGAINSTVAITAGGSGYLYPPNLVFDAPPTGGVQATGYCTISAGAINAVTVTNQGAGYVTAPAITLVNDPRDAVGTGGVLTVNATLAGSGTVTALYPTNVGTAVTAVPTLTPSVASGFPGSGLAATAVMNFVVTGFSPNSGLSGAGYGNAQPFLIIVAPTIVGGTRASNVAGPIADTALTAPQAGWITGVTTSGGKITSVNAVVADAGFGLQAVPNGFVVAGGTGLGTTTAVVTITVGGITDTSWVQPI